jgi:hypothetical protein
VILRRNLLIHGLGGILLPFAGIKAIDMWPSALRRGAVRPGRARVGAASPPRREARHRGVELFERELEAAP